MQPTPEQQVIIDFAVSSKENLLIRAFAGTAKTTTLEFIARALPIQPILCLAFNKRIAVAMTQRMPGHLTCKTFNAVGIWATACGKRLTVDSKKSYELLKLAIEALPRNERADARDCFAETLKAVSAAKMQGYVPEGKFSHAKRLASRADFIDSFDEEPGALILSLVDEVLGRSIAAAYEGLIDFDDQIYMPTLFGGTFPRFPLVLVDEAQDLSPLNHAMLRKLVTARLIAVGDPYQSIYAFRGAMTSSMARLREEFAMHEMTLSVSFRCPRQVVRRAWFRVPFMKWFEQAEEGHVEVLREWSAISIPDGAAIICRNNAPLYKTAMDLIRAGRGVQLVGADIGPGLVKVLRSLGPESTPKEQCYGLIDKWEAERLRKAKGKASIADRAECLRVFCSFGRNLGEAISYAEHLFKQQGPVQLLSGHKSKGLEWDVVYHLDPWRIPSVYTETPEELEQELNVRYVIETRAKRELYLVTREGFQGKPPEPNNHLEGSILLERI
jgi:DNA helicase-2/ATP-dependent DNA helicase PcrA